MVPVISQRQEEVLPGWWEGQRIVDEEGYRGTVRYVGPVATAKDPESIWIGVEWDEPTRGKHDGSVVKPGGEVVRHFHCRKAGSTCASFVKPSKLDRGVGFMDVLHQRYVKPDAPLEAPNRVFEGVYANTSRGGQKQIEFLGEEKIRRYQQIPLLEKVSMRGERVAWAGEAVQEEASHLVEVDVQGNLLSDWAEVGKLTSQMPRLEVLHLNSNSFLPLDLVTAPPILQTAFLSLRVLVLNSCSLTSWSTIMALERFLPALQELSVANNHLSDILDVCKKAGPATNDNPPTRVQGFQRLQRLDLSATGLSCWSQVQVFADLPDLGSLHLNENQLTGLSWGQGPQGFTRLESLHLSSNAVADWLALDQLNRYKQLQGLRFTNNPVTKAMGQSEARQILIGRLRLLTRLNGAQISRKERVDAEKSYLRRVTRETSQAGEEEASRAAVMAHHPRYKELLELYGEGSGGQGLSEGTSTLASELLTVKLISMAPESVTMAPVEKRLPGSLTVGRLKQFLHRLFKLEPDLQTLYYKADKDALPIVIEEEEETLAYCGIPNGCEIYMNVLDVQSRAREEGLRKKEEDERISLQMRQVQLLDNYRKAQVLIETASVQKAVAGAEM